MDERVNGSSGEVPAAAWGPFEAIPVAIAALALTSLAMAVATAAASGTIAARVGLLAFPLSLAAVSLFWVRARHPGGLAAMRLRSRRPVSDFFLGLLGGVGLYVFTGQVVFWVVDLLFRLFTDGGVPLPTQAIFDPKPGAAEIAVVAVAVIVAAPIGEEIFFRGFLFRSLRRRLPMPAAALISGAVFGLFHIEWLLIVLLFPVGVLLAYIYEQVGSLLVPIAAHAAFNVIGFAFLLADALG